jgi:hypothetical protein
MSSGILWSEGVTLSAETMFSVDGLDVPVYIDGHTVDLEELAPMERGATGRVRDHRTVDHNRVQVLRIQTPPMPRADAVSLLAHLRTPGVRGVSGKLAVGVPEIYVRNVRMSPVAGRMYAEVSFEGHAATQRDYEE